MNALDEISVLIVESRAGMRTQLREMLGLAGITKIELAPSAGLAMFKLRESSFDVILCEYHLGEGQDGQHFLEDIRNHRLIPLPTVFIMVTGEASYERVMGAAELAPQDYLLKPFNAETLKERLLRAIDKRNALLPVHHSMEQGRPLDAIAVCQERENEFPQYKIDFLRLRAELHVAAGQPEQAEALYRLVAEQRALPWAKLGLAKTLYMRKEYDSAESILAALVQANENYLDAYDWLARTREATGRLAEAQEALNNAVKLSPHTVRRLRKLGEVSVELGDMKTAERAIAEVVRKGKYSGFRDPEDHVNLIKTQLGMGDAAKAATTLRDLERSMSGLAKTPLCMALSKAMVASQAGDAEEAAAALDEAIKHRDPKANVSSSLQKDLAKICLKHSREREASDIIMDLMRNAADDAGVEQTKLLLTQAGRAELGDTLAGRVREEVRAIMAAGADLAKAGDYDGAVRQMMEAVRRLPGNTQALLNAALALLKHIENRGWNAVFARQSRDFIERVRTQDPCNARLSAMTSYFEDVSKRLGVGASSPMCT
jgi:DNA-binding response OmpR family regulator